MNKDLNLNSIIVKNDSLISSKLDEGLVMMSLENNSYYGLDEIGKRVWEIIEDKISVQDLINILTNEYNVSNEECQKDIMELLKQLKKEDMILVE